ncbi:ribosome-associated translation inhibitor RaiA [Phenylobacterium sp. LjRoot219]|uniref:ribosome hibernation-promoting factor, HPF/YfiA family n=1 Tax=Phenylobacterium sp. LjRoot219 TaxID=3342283 RepID=UPI003ED0F532
MQVQVTGKHVDVGDALRTRVADELTNSIGKYFDRGGGADVVVSREGHSFKVDCSVTLASGQQLTTHGLGGDAHMAVGAAVSKMERRVRRYKRRLKDHHLQALAKQQEVAAYFVLQPTDFEEEEEEPELINGADSLAAFPEPMIIAETETPVRTMTVSMAVMQLDLTEAQAIMFRNAAHGGLSVVYRRGDGNIGWIDPERTNSNGEGTDGIAEA